MNSRIARTSEICVDVSTGDGIPLSQGALSRRRRRAQPFLAGMILLPVLAGCGSSGPYKIPFMPPPAFLESAEIPPFSSANPIGVSADDPEVLYATLREPAGPDGENRFYSPERASELRVGSGRVALAGDDVTWEMARRISRLKSASDPFPLHVADIKEYGILDNTLHPVLDTRPSGPPDPGPRERFVREINEHLASSRDPDIFIYVHGYKVNFENPILVAAQLWHFLGYEGVFIPFAWPSRLGRLDYFGDTESARYSAVFLRALLKLLADETQVRRIHILGYSAGTRVVGAALHQLALLNTDRSTDEIRRRLKLGNVILVGSDIDRDIADTYVMDGILRVQERLTFYESPKDKALGMALLAFGRERAGQLDPSNMPPGARDILLQSDQLSLISVANAPGFTAGNGHSYFRDSPLVSSDLLATLRYDLSPAERGLVQNPETGVWEFPPDYLPRLERKIYQLDPDLARRVAVNEANSSDGR